MAQQSKNDGFGRPIHDASYNKIWAGKYTPQLSNTTQNINTITGTTNQVNVTNNTKGDVTLSLPQDIDTNATPQFAGLLSQTSTNINLGSYVGMSGQYNTLVGEQAGQNITSNELCCFGYKSGVNATSGSTMIGYAAGYQSAGDYHVVLGHSCGQGLSGSSKNCIFIGNFASPSENRVQNEIVIGSNDSKFSGMGSSTAFIKATAGFYTTNPSCASFQYTGNGTIIPANTAIPLTTEFGAASGYMLNSNGQIFMNVAGFYQINVTASVAELTPNMANIAFYLQRNNVNTRYKMLTQPNATNQNVSLSVNLPLAQPDSISVIYNTELAFGIQSIISLNIIYIGVL